MEDKHYIECGYGGKKLRIEFDFIDPNMDDWKEAFKTIMVFLTYHPDLCREMFNEREE